MLKHKNIFWIVVAILSAVIFPSASSASTTSDLQTQIQALQAQLQALQAQLSSQQGSSPFCHTFNSNLSVGQTGSDVSALQTALQKEGFQTGQSGQFDEKTASAVSGFQEKYASEILTPLGLQYGTGYLGSSTRAELNRLYGCGTGAGSSSSGAPLSASLNTSLSSPNLIEGETQVEIASFELTVAQGQDVSVNSISMESRTGFTNLRAYFTGGAYSENGAQYGSAQAGISGAETSPNYTFSFTLYPSAQFPVQSSNGSVFVNVYADISSNATQGYYPTIRLDSINYTVLNNSGGGSATSALVNLSGQFAEISGSSATISQVTGLTASSADGSVSLSWRAATAANGVGVYNIYRGVSSGFTPGSSNLIAQANALSFTDSNLSSGTYYYAVAAQDVDGNVGPASTEATADIGSNVINSVSLNSYSVSPGGTLTVNWTRTGNFSLPNTYYFVYLKKSSAQLLGSGSYGATYIPIIFRQSSLGYPSFSINIPTGSVPGAYYLELDYADSNGNPLASYTTSAVTIASASQTGTLSISSDSSVVSNACVSPSNCLIGAFTLTASGGPVTVSQIDVSDSMTNLNSLAPSTFPISIFDETAGETTTSYNSMLVNNTVGLGVDQNGSLLSIESGQSATLYIYGNFSSFSSSSMTQTSEPITVSVSLPELFIEGSNNMPQYFNPGSAVNVSGGSISVIAPSPTQSSGNLIISSDYGLIPSTCGNLSSCLIGDYTLTASDGSTAIYQLNFSEDAGKTNSSMPTSFSATIRDESTNQNIYAGPMPTASSIGISTNQNGAASINLSSGQSVVLYFYGDFSNFPSATAQSSIQSVEYGLNLDGAYVNGQTNYENLSF